MNLLDIVAIAFGVGALVQIVWLAWRSGLLVRGQDYTNSDKASDEKRVADVVDSQRAELDYMRKDGLL